MKRLFALILCAVILLSALAGCQSSGMAEKTEPQYEPTETKPEQTETEPDVTEPLPPTKISVGVPGDPAIEDYDSEPFTLWLEQKSGRDLILRIFCNTKIDYQTQIATLALLITESPEAVPEILWNMELDSEDQNYMAYGADGFFADLADWYRDRERSLVFWQTLESLPEQQQKAVLDQLYTENGEAFAFCRILPTQTGEYQVFFDTYVTAACEDLNAALELLTMMCYSPDAPAGWPEADAG